MFREMLTRKTRKNSLIKSYSARCRICLKSFQNYEKYIHITNLIRERFLAIMHIELKESLEEYSNIICETCDTELRNVQAWRKEIIKKQKKLMTFVKDGIVHIKTEQKSDPESEGSEELSENEQLSESDFDDDDGEEERFRKFNVTKYTCDICGKKTLLKTVFEAHMKSHAEKALEIIKVESMIVDAEPKHKNLINKVKNYGIKPGPKKKQHDPLPIYKCQCGIEFNHNSEFIEHNKKFHININKGNPCPHCEKSYYAKKDLTSHIKRVHLKVDGEIYCEICGNQYSSRASLNVHRKIHSNPEFICSFPGCGKEFWRKDKLNLHEKRHRGQRDHMCHMCDKSFLMSSQLNRHISFAHENFTFKCLVLGCTYSVTTKEYLRLHLITNHRELEKDVLDQHLQEVRDMKIV